MMDLCRKRADKEFLPKVYIIPFDGESWFAATSFIP